MENESRSLVALVMTYIEEGMAATVDDGASGRR